MQHLSNDLVINFFSHKTDPSKIKHLKSLSKGHRQLNVYQTFTISNTYNTHIVKVSYTQTYHRNCNNDNHDKEDTDNNDNHAIIMMKIIIMIIMMIIGHCLFLMNEK